MNGTIETPATEIDARPFTWTLDAQQVEATRAKLAKINARAAKRGLGGRLDLEVTERLVTETKDHRGFVLPIPVTYTVFDAVIVGEAPSYNGWAFIATLDWDAHAGLIVRAVPGAEVVDRSKLVEGYCDHCKKTRTRRETFVVRNAETGEQLQVGRSCIKDFIGWNATVAFPSDELPTDDDGWGGFFGARGDVAYDPATVLAYAWAAIHEFGFVPASSFDGRKTRDVVVNALYPPTGNSKHDVEARAEAAELAKHAAEATTEAAAILAFILSDDFNGSSDYVTNLKAVAAAPLVSRRNIGLLASAPQAHAKHVEKTLVRETVKLVSDHIGVVGQRGTFTATVTKVTGIEGQYGTSYLVVLVTEEGNVLKTFSSGAFGYDAKQGQVLTFKGTVKAHSEYNGIKQTELSRVAVV